MAFVEVAANTLDGAYEIDNSCQFNTDAYCEFTPSSGSGSTQFTYSAWVKNCGAGDQSETGMILSGAGAGSGADNAIQFPSGGSAGKIQFIEYDGGDNAYYIRTNRLFRDPSAWMHVVLIYDAPDSTAGDRMRLYINGTRETSFSHEVQLPQDRAHAGFTRSGVAIRIGAQASGSNQRFNGYLADVYFCDGQNYEPSEFGETDDNGVWIPKKADVSFGTNGFKLEFKQTGTSANASGIGADTSGNDNHFSVSGLDSTNITTDTPTNNFATLNRLTARTHPELREGNLQQYEHGSTNSAGAAATIMPINGKWYCELFLNGPSAGDYPMLGITDTINLNQQDAQGTKMAAGFEIDGVTNNQSTTNLGTITNTNTGWPTFADNDIVMFALDCDNRKLWIGRQGTWINSGDPAGESNHQLSWTVSDNVCPFLLGYDNSQSGGGGDESIWNYGNPPFAISSSNADANGYGNFEYGVPSGFYALCTKNLAEYG